jgi:hypothetical protein
MLLMKNKSFYKLFIFLGCLACLFLSCDREEADTAATGTGTTGTEAGRPMIHGEEICFANDKPAKSTDYDFEAGDEVGIYAVSRNGSQKSTLRNSGNAADNKHYRFDGDQFVAVGESDKIFYEAGTVLDFYVYYPYTPDIENVSAYSFTISGDQSEDFDRNDLCWASNETGDMTNPVSLNFKHKLSQVHLRFNTGAAGKPASAKIHGIIPSASLNLQTGAIVTADKPKQPAELFPCGKSGEACVYRSLLPAQDIKKGATLFSFAVNGKEREFKASQDISFKSGQRHSFEFALQYRITVEAQGEGNVYGGGIYEHGEPVTVYGKEHPGWHLTGWFEDDTLVCDQLEYTFEAARDRRLVIKYAPVDKATITVHSSGGGSAEGGGTFSTGENCTVRASGHPSWYFSGWYEDGIRVSSTEEYSFRVTADRELEARFLPYDVYVEVRFYGMGMGVGMDTSGPIAYGSAKVEAYYYKDGRRETYYPEYAFSVSVSFRYTAANPVNGRDLGYMVCRKLPLRVGAGSGYNLYRLFYWDNAMVSANRMSDLNAILNMRLDRSGDQTSRVYTFLDNTVGFYRENLWPETEGGYPLIKTLTNQRNSSY